MSTAPFESVQKYLIFFSYFGRQYRGVQSQTRRIPTFESIGVYDQTVDHSVQFNLEKALSRLLPKPKNEVKIGISSRTDSGVHACVNTLQLYLQHPFNGSYMPHHIVNSANEYLSAGNHDIMLKRAIPVNSRFCSVKHALSRTYVYRIAVVKRFVDSKNFNPLCLLPIDELHRCYPVCSPLGYLDLEKMQEVCDLFIGTHNFKSFESSNDDGRSPERTVYECCINFSPERDLNRYDPSYKNIDIIEVVVKGKSFLYNQVRRMVAAMIAVGKGESSVDFIRSLLNEPGKVNWKVRIAPAEGLYLTDIEYDHNDFINPRILNPDLVKESAETPEERQQLSSNQ